MKNKSLFGSVATYTIFLSVIFSGSVLIAEDWHELSAMSEPELVAKISDFEHKLNQTPGDNETLKTLGIAYHIMAIKNPRTYAPLAYKTLSKAYKKIENDYDTLCYLGSATTMMAMATNDVSQMGSYASKGIALMDKAVRMAPDSITVRLIRAHNSKSLPGFFGRRSLAIEDFEYLAEMIRRKPRFPVPVKKQVYSNLSDLYEKSGETAKAEEYKKLADGI